MTDQQHQMGRMEGRLEALERHVARMEARFEGQTSAILAKLDGVSDQLALIRGERMNSSQTWARIVLLPGAIAALVGLAMTWVGKH